MRRLFYLLLLLLLTTWCFSSSAGKFVQTPYSEQNVLFEFYFNHPDHMGPALYWLRSYINPLMQSPYQIAPEFLNIVVVIHGAEIVTLVKKNRTKYQSYVERLEYYADFGVKFKVCSLSASDYGYKNSDFPDYIELVPSAMPELAHWQQKGYALIVPKIKDKLFSIDEIR